MLIQAGIRHRGFALIDILQPCVSFNRVNTYKWYQERVEKIDNSHDTNDRNAALNLSMQSGDRILTGIFLRRERATYTDRMGVLKDRPLKRQQYDPERLRKILRRQAAVDP